MTIKRRPTGQNYFAPLPTSFRKYKRVSLFYQFIRFIILNVKMLRMVRKH